MPIPEENAHGTPPSGLMARIAAEEETLRSRPKPKPEPSTPPREEKLPPLTAGNSQPSMSTLPKAPEVPPELKRLLDLITLDRRTTLTLSCVGEDGDNKLSVDMDVLAYEEREIGNDGLCCAFLLPRKANVRLGPANDITLTYEGVTRKATYLGQQFDFGGVLPFRFLTFIYQP